MTSKEFNRLSTERKVRPKYYRFDKYNTTYEVYCFTYEGKFYISLDGYKKFDRYNGRYHRWRTYYKTIESCIKEFDTKEEANKFFVDKFYNSGFVRDRRI